MLVLKHADELFFYDSKRLNFLSVQCFQPYKMEVVGLGVLHFLSSSDLSFLTVLMTEIQLIS